MGLHRVGIRVIAKGVPLAPGYIQAICDECGWEGTKFKHARVSPKQETQARLAQAEAIEHQGGKLRIRERIFRRKPPHREMAEMFPDAR